MKRIWCFPGQLTVVVERGKPVYVKQAGEQNVTLARKQAAEMIRQYRRCAAGVAGDMRPRKS